MNLNDLRQKIKNQLTFQFQIKNRENLFVNKNTKELDQLLKSNQENWFNKNSSVYIIFLEKKEDFKRIFRENLWTEELTISNSEKIQIHPYIVVDTIIFSWQNGFCIPKILDGFQNYFSQVKRICSIQKHQKDEIITFINQSNRKYLNGNYPEFTIDFFKRIKETLPPCYGFFDYFIETLY